MAALADCVGSVASVFFGKTQTKYGALSLVLAAAHFVVSGLVAASDEDDQFQVPYVYNFNSWTPQDDEGDGNCGSGCIIKEERYSFSDEDENRLNVNTMIACYGFISGSNHFIQWILCVTGFIDKWLVRTQEAREFSDSIPSFNSPRHSTCCPRIILLLRFSFLFSLLSYFSTRKTTTSRSSGIWISCSRPL
ncbi:MAG: hypothetical protein ACPGR8_14610 [Limisphaerales bacterium]